MMYSNNGTCHSGRNPYMSLKPSDYGLKEPEIHSLRISSPADGSSSTPPSTSSRASPSVHKTQAAHNVASAEGGGPLSSHPVTPVESPDRPILEVPPKSATAEAPTSAVKRASTSPLDPNSVPDLSLHMPGTQRHHSHSSSAPDDHYHHKNDTFATRFLRLRSLSTTLRGKNDSKLSLSLSSMGLNRPRSSHSTTSSSMPPAPLARSSTTPLAGTKRPASRGSTQLDEQISDHAEASRRTIGRRARKTSAALLATARRASGFWGADDGTAENKKRQKQGQQQDDPGAAYRLPELRGVDVELRADRMFAGAS